MISPQGDMPVDPTARLFAEAITHLRWKADANALAERVAQLSLGLPSEDEFSILLAWLGRCRLVHKLDQAQAPKSSRHEYQVPDLAAFFENSPKPQGVLVEVKSSPKMKLSFSPRYFDRIRRYADLLDFPLLFAWKQTALNVWSLFESRHFQQSVRKYSITFEKALKESLLGVLAGDFLFKLPPSSGLHIQAEKVRVVERSAEDNGSERWLIKIVDAHFTDREGARRNKLGPGVWAMFLVSKVNEVSKVEGDIVALSYTVDEGGGAQWAHRALPALLRFQEASPDPVNWRHVLEEQAFPISRDALHDAAVAGIEQKLVDYVFYLHPGTRPAFPFSPAFSLPERPDCSFQEGSQHGAT